MISSSDARARLARSSSRRSSPYRRSTLARAACAFSSARAYACFFSGTPAHAPRDSARMAFTSAGVYSEHTFSLTRCAPPRRSIIASRCSITRPHASKYASGMTYPVDRTIELELASSPTVTGVPSSRRRSTRTTFPRARDTDPSSSSPRSAAAVSNKSSRSHFPPSSPRESTRRSRASLSVAARVVASTSTTRSRHTFGPARRAPPSSHCAASSHVAFAASYASNAASAASDADVISTCASSYSRCRSYTVAHVFSSRTRHTIASE